MTPRILPETAPEPGVVLLSADCRALRRTLRPLVWVTLEEVALDSVVECGRLVARTSARQIAARLGHNPGTVAKALAELRDRGLIVSYHRETGPTGRFGLSFYELGPVAGVSVIQPGTAVPCAAKPRAGTPHMEPPGMEEPASSAAAVSDFSAVIQRAASPGRPRRTNFCEVVPPASLQCPGQTALDLGSVS